MDGYLFEFRVRILDRRIIKRPPQCFHIIIIMYQNDGRKSKLWKLNSDFYIYI